jgi:copper(I)-binding protein
MTARDAITSLAMVLVLGMGPATVRAQPGDIRVDNAWARRAPQGGTMGMGGHGTSQRERGGTLRVEAPVR